MGGVAASLTFMIPRFLVVGIHLNLAGWVLVAGFPHLVRQMVPLELFALVKG